MIMTILFWRKFRQTKLVEQYLLDYNIFLQLSQYLWAKKGKNYFWLFLYKSYAFFIIIFYIIICLFEILYLILLIMLSYEILCKIAENLEKFNIYFFLHFFGLLFFIIISFIFIISFLFYLSKDFNILKNVLFNSYNNHIYINISDNIFNNTDIFTIYLVYFVLNSNILNNIDTFENLMNYFRKMSWNLNKKSILFYCYIYIYFILKFFYKLWEKFDILILLVVLSFLSLNFIIIFFIFCIFSYWLFSFLESLIFKIIINELNFIFFILINCISDKELFEIFGKTFEFYNAKFTFKQFVNFNSATYTRFINLNIEIHKRLLKYINNK